MSILELYRAFTNGLITESEARKAMTEKVGYWSAIGWVDGWIREVKTHG